MSDIFAAHKLRQKYKHFRILVIGRANAGKTTLLQRVCNTTEEPCIYDENNNNLLEPTDGRGLHDINRPFVFRNNPQFIFHDSIGFEAGDESMLKTVQDFIEKHAKATETNEQLHAIWFCFTPDRARFLLELEKRFFNEKRSGNIPVIAIFTKFDDLITQVYDDHLDERKNRERAETLLKDLQAPLFKLEYPPKTSVCVEDLHHDNGTHQEQVKLLIRKTAASLDLALRMLFISLQQNNLQLCIEYAVEHTRVGSGSVDLASLTIKR
ncbi:hypothetical protein C0992_012908 [Termitomyces sp. T32_za158]|nr:hypothetical protein C0992_012908 [Termitomyces sp. T32_za158]